VQFRSFVAKEWYWLIGKHSIVMFCLQWLCVRVCQWHGQWWTPWQ